MNTQVAHAPKKALDHEEAGSCARDIARLTALFSGAPETAGLVAPPDWVRGLGSSERQLLGLSRA